MILKIGLQRRVVIYELLVFRQRRIAAKLLGDFPVFVQELIEAGNLAMVAVTRFLARVVIHAVGVILTVVVPVAHIVVVAIAIVTHVAVSVIASIGAVIGVTIPCVVVAAILVASACVISVVVPARVVAIKITI